MYTANIVIENKIHFFGKMDDFQSILLSIHEFLLLYPKHNNNSFYVTTFPFYDVWDSERGLLC